METKIKDERPMGAEEYVVQRVMKLERENTTLRANLEAKKMEAGTLAKQLDRWKPRWTRDKEAPTAYSERMYLTPQQAGALKRWMQDQGVEVFENEDTIGRLGDAE